MQSSSRVALGRNCLVDSMYGCRVFGLTLGLGGDFLRGEGWRTRRAEDNAGDATSSSTEIDSGFWEDVSRRSSAHISASRSSPDRLSSRESGWGGGGGSAGSWASFICDRDAISSLFVNLPARIAPTNRCTSPAPALGDRGVRLSSLSDAKSSAFEISPDCIALTKLETCWPLAGGGGGASASSSAIAFCFVAVPCVGLSYGDDLGRFASKMRNTVLVPTAS